MGVIFNTIKENIRSFFQKEEALLKEPKQPPESASEVLGGMSIPENKPPSPKVSSSISSLPKKLPSSSELHAALNQPQEEPKQETAQNPVVFDDDIKAFEEAVQYLSPPQERSKQPASSIPVVAENGFFSSFSEFLETDTLDPQHLEGDLLHKMRVYHQREREGKEPLLHKRSATDAVRRRLEELQMLEHDWQRFYAKSHDIERSMIHLEEEIEEKTRALKTLLHESQRLALLAQEVREEKAFVLANGVRIRSLGALLRALRTDEWLFAKHVSGERNDFALWVAGALELHDLANRLRSASSVDEFAELLHHI